MHLRTLRRVLVLLGLAVLPASALAAAPAPAPTVSAASATRVNSARFDVSAVVSTHEPGTLHYAARATAGRTVRNAGAPFAHSTRIIIRFWAPRGVRSVQLAVTVTDAKGHRWSFVRWAALPRLH
jgi:hypothetical protein